MDINDVVYLTLSNQLDLIACSAGSFWSAEESERDGHGWWKACVSVRGDGVVVVSGVCVW